MIVLDTNVISELMKPAPAAPVLRWVAQHPASALFTTSVTQAEVLYGVLLMPAGKRRSQLDATAQAMFAQDFGHRVLPFNADAAHAFADIAARRRRAGKPISQFDAQVAAIALAARAAVATRKVADFSDCGVTVINPWEF